MRVCIFLIFLPFMAFADTCVVSLSSGNSLCFSNPMSGGNYERGSWGTMYLLRDGKKVPIEIENRYYSTASEDDISPSGNYINITTVEGGYIEGDGEKEYVDRAYCNVIDMRTGCIVSDWDGSMCGYQWKKNEDVLSSSAEGDSDTLDFLSFKPKVSVVDKINDRNVRNLLRCDAVNDKNIDAYANLLKANNKNKEILTPVANFYNTLPGEGIVIDKSWLHSEANDDSVTKVYLVAGDPVKFIVESNDKKWRKVIYNASGKRFYVGWIKSENIR